MSLKTPGLHCRYDWVLVSWGGGTGTYADPESYVIGGPTFTTFFFFFFFLLLFFFFGFFVCFFVEDPNTAHQ